MTERWRKLHNDELHKLHPLPSTIRNDEGKEDEIGRARSTNGAKMNADRVLVGKPEGKRPLGRPNRR
jgi:hypothetical protein